MNKNKSKERTCEICNDIFYVEFPSSKCRSCPKNECRKKIKSIATTNFFINNPKAKENLSNIIKQKWNDQDYKEKTLKGIKEIRNFKKENHPSWGLKRIDEQKNNIKN